VKRIQPFGAAHHPVGRRIRWLGVVLTLCFVVVLVQLVNVQYVKAPALRASAENPRNAAATADNRRGNIYASDGTLLAESVRISGGSYDYTREYPGGSLYSQVVGFDSTYEGTAGVENEYDGDLSAHQQPASTFPQALGLDKAPILGVWEQQTDALLPLEPEASTALIERLFAHLYRPEHVYAHDWEVDDLVIWDNHAVQHSRSEVGAEKPRTLRRVSIGEKQDLSIFAQRVKEPAQY
jgi:TfdA family taurine catabolism dioxygenase TauD/penicillin-binding protein